MNATFVLARFSFLINKVLQKSSAGYKFGQRAHSMPTFFCEIVHIKSRDTAVSKNGDYSQNSRCPSQVFGVYESTP